MIYFIVSVLVLFSALFSGLTLGLMSLNVHELKRKAKLGDVRARKVYRIRRRGNLLLTTLLLGNVGVNAILSIFLGSLFSGILAGIMATPLIFLLGEIIPQAVMSRHALRFGATTSWFVGLITIILYPVCAPIAWGLDKALGHEIPTIYSRNELLSIIEEHEDSHASDIDRDEERIVRGALTFSEKQVKDVMTPMSLSLMVEVNDKFNPVLLKRLKNSGHSRIPVYKDTVDSIVGMLYMKDLVGKSFSRSRVESVYRKNVEHVLLDASLDKVLNRFLRTRNHLFLVQDNALKTIGVISVEDILEEIVGREIVDESDKHVDMRKEARRRKRNKN
ncbi:MAG: CNNM domain-containing protein [bacterium]|nr:CNNM domain-containing protein [bacterium]